WSRLVVVMTLVAGSCALLALTWLLDRIGLGGGFSLVLTAPGLFSLVPTFVTARARLGEAASKGGTVALLLVGAVVGTGFVLRWRPAGTVPLPACGVMPVHWVAGIAAVATTVAQGDLARRLSPFVLEAGATSPTVLLLTAAAAILFGFLFNPPRRVAALDT